MIAKICLLLNVVAYGLYAYMFIFAPDKLLDGYGVAIPKEKLFKESLWPMMVGILRYLGCAYITLTFLIGHVFFSKPSAGLKTAAMYNTLFTLVVVHRLYFEDPNSVYATPPALHESVKKSLSAAIVLLVITFLGLATVQDPPKEKTHTK